MESNTGTLEMATEAVTKDKLVTDLKTVLHDAEGLIKATAGDLNERTKDARARLSAAMERAKVTCRDVEQKAIAGAKATDQIIRDHPYPSIGVAFGIGLLIGVLVNRK